MTETKQHSNFTQEEIEEIQEAFSMFDTNGDSTIDPAMLK